jgi:hypothetical protein
MVDENVAEHKRACWDQRRVLICTRCSKTADAALIAEGHGGYCNGMLGWLMKHNWVTLKGGNMETTKQKSASEKMTEEFTDLVERLYEVEGSPVPRARFATREEHAIRALRARVEALELAQKELTEYERLKGIVREVLNESKIRLGDDGYHHIELA